MKQNLILTSVSILVVLLVLEMLIRVFDLAPPGPTLQYNSQTHLTTLGPYEQGIFSFGKWGQIKARYQINNTGWSNIQDYDSTDTRPLVAIIGDSFVQSATVNPAEHFGNLLQQKLGQKYRVYTFGMSGASLCQYLNIARYVKRVFRPQMMVFNIVHNDFDNSFCEFRSNGRGEMCLDTTHLKEHYLDFIPYKTFGNEKLHRFVYSSALVRYLSRFGNISTKLNEKPLTQYNQNTEPAKLWALHEKIDGATELIIKKIAQENDSTRLLLMMDGLRMDIYANTVKTSNLAWLHTLVKEKAAAQKIDFIDLTDTFATDYQQYGQRFEHNIDYHWNAYAHTKVAEVLNQFLTTNQWVTH